MENKKNKGVFLFLRELLYMGADSFYPSPLFISNTKIIEMQVYRERYPIEVGKTGWDKF